jgi:hypothetical protein
MKFRTLSMLTAVALLCACSDSVEDPAQPAPGPGPGTDAGGVVPGGDTGGGGTDPTTDAGGNGNGGDPVADGGGGTDPGTDTGGGGTDSGGDAGGVTEPGTDAGPPAADGGTPPNPATCRIDRNFFGQVEVGNTTEPFGGAPRSTPYDPDYDSGILAVRSAVAAIPTDEFRPQPAELSIRGATVVATSFRSANATANRNNFWIADGQGFIEVQLDFRNEQAVLPDFPMRVGHQLDFDVTAVQRSFGRPIIQAGANWEVTEVDQEVYIEDIERTLTADDVGRVVRLAGFIQNGTTENCGNNNRCWDLDYGSGTLTFRSTSTFINDGACITFVGPVSLFSGALQLNTTNFNWYRARR